MSNTYISLKALIVFVTIAFLVSSCYKEPSFSLIPEIEFLEIEKSVVLDQFTGSNKDSLVVSIKFRDGDGDLGFDSDEIKLAQKTNNFNYLIKPFRKIKGKFVEFKTIDPISGYFPRLKNDGRIGPIEGTLFYSIDFFHSYTPKRDTLKFEIQLKDRFGNASNAILTEEVIANQF